jgi:peptidoglycan/LPS O-acetylase OafA/YrhL
MEKPLVDSKSGHIPSLDGLRAISIAMVVAFHAVNAALRPALGHDYEGRWRVICNGALGVSVFFTLSGYLITLLLVREFKKTGRTDLIAFYIRRAFRIWPAFWFYLVVVFFLAARGWIAIGHRDLLAAAFFVFNYFPHAGGWWVGHSWSLSIEEQFYLFWPVLFVLLGPRKATLAAVFLILISPVIRVSELLLLPPTSEFIVRMWEMTHTRLDGLMFGCAIGLLHGEAQFKRAVKVAFKFGAHWVALLYLFYVAPHFVGRLFRLYHPAFGYTLESASVSLLVLWCVQNARSWPGRFLNSRPLVHLGRISYSLYLWQQLFLTFFNKTWTGRFPMNVVCAVVMAELSFVVIERPFLNLRSKLTLHRRSAESRLARMTN